MSTIDSVNQRTFRVRQTFLCFGPNFEETFRTVPEAEDYARVVAAGIAGIFFHRAGNYADIPYLNPRRKNPDRETAFFMQLSRHSGAYSDVDGKGLRFRVCGKMKWRELINRINYAVIEIKRSAARSPSP